MDRRHLREGAPEPPDRIGRRHRGGWRQHGWRREVLGLDIGPSEAETFWTSSAQAGPARPARGQAGDLRRPRGIKASVAKVMTASWRGAGPLHAQRLAHAGRSGRRVVSAFIATAFAQEDARGSSPAMARGWPIKLRPKVPQLAALMDTAETDVLASMGLPGRPPCQAALDQPARAPQRRRSSAAPRSSASSPTSLDPQARRRDLLEQKRRVGRAALPIHDPGKHRPIGDDPLVSLPNLAV